jgi:alanine racemase
MMDPKPDAHASTGEQRVMRPRRAAPADAVRPTRAEVDLGALRDNAHYLARKAGNSKVWAVLKADGYGHGAPAIARTLERCPIGGFCVALLEEAIELREAGIVAPILIMGGYYGRAYEEVIERDLTPVIYDAGHIEGFARVLRARTAEGAERPRTLGVHVKVDTGMARLGVRPEGLEAFATLLRAHPELRVDALMTHLAQADAPDGIETDQQLRRFDAATATLAERGVRAPMRHAGNSAALLRGHALLDAVRPGVALFGVSPFSPKLGPSIRAGAAATSSGDSLRHVMRVRTEVVDVRQVQRGDRVGYGGTFCASKPTRIATVAMGYADGLPRSSSPGASMLIGGKRAQLVGAVSMDMATLDVTEIPNVACGDEVVVLGRQDGPLGHDLITVEELAAHADQIPWEVLTQISRRVPRFYRDP